MLSSRRLIVRAKRFLHQSVACRTAAMAQGQVTVNGVKLHYEIRGRGSHPIICIPGALGTIASDFGPQLDYFGREGSDFKIVAFDPRGYGDSRPADRFEGGAHKNFFIADAMDAHGLMQTLSFSKYSVLGWSDGGAAALILAASFPESVRKLVTWGAGAYLTQEDVDLIEKTRDITTWNSKMRDPLVKVYGSSLQNLWSNWMDAVIKVYKDNNGNVCKEEVSKISCPTLIVHGAKDPLVPSFHPTYLRDHVTGSKLVVMEEGRHNLHLRYHQEFNKTVEDFLKEYYTE